jgi:hypothetical protein
MATKAKSAIEELADLEEAVRVAERRKQDVDAGQRAAARAVSAAESRRLQLEEARGAGEDVDPEEIAEAVAAIEEAKAEADELVWSARLAGAERAIQEAEAERDRFGAFNFAAIAAEEALQDGPVRDALVEAHSALVDAANAYAVRVRRWHHLSRYGRFSPASIPTGNPLAGDMDEVGRRFEMGLPLPTPPQLREE